MPLTQAHHEVSVTSGAGADVLLFARMAGSEQLGRPFEYRVQLASAPGRDVPVADVLGKPMAVTVALPGGGERVFHGIVTRFAGSGVRGGFERHEATLRPWLWLLTRSTNSRIFQEMNVVDIVTKVCEAGQYGTFDLDAGGLTATYPLLPYRVQYRESDFNFVCRLLEEAGIYYFFRHEAGRHTMVLADSHGAHAAMPGYGTIEFAADGGSVIDRETVHRWESAGEIQASTIVLNDYDFEKPSMSNS